MEKVQTPQGVTLSANTTGGQTPKFCRKKAKIQFFTIFIPWNMPNTHRNHSKQTSILYGWNESSKSSGRLHLCTPWGVKFTYFDQKWHTIFCCLANYFKILTIKWYKAATLWHFQQSIRLFLYNECLNNREYHSIRPPQGIK